MEDKEIEEALVNNMNDMSFEDIVTEDDSPINEPVKEGEVSTGEVTSVETEEVKETSQGFGIKDQEVQQESNQDYHSPSAENESQEDHAPEQPLDKEEEEEEIEGNEEAFVSQEMAELTADSLLGMTDYALEIGGGFFVKIKKSKEMMDFTEVLQIVEEQNEKNIRRIKLDEQDKALLRPLLIQIAKKRAKKLSPEQQLIAAVITILVKKVQVMAEIKTENKLLLININHAIKRQLEAERKAIEKAQQQAPPPPQEQKKVQEEVLEEKVEGEIEVIEKDGTIQEAA